MMAFTEQNIITIDDLRAYAKISNNINSTHLNAWILRAQRNNLRYFLGEELYFALFSDYSATRFSELVAGKDYEYSGEDIHFFGIKPLVVFYTLAIIIEESSEFIADYGLSSFEGNPDEQMKSSKIRANRIAAYMREANKYENDASKFLNENTTTYPEWDCTNEDRSTTRFDITII